MARLPLHALKELLFPTKWPDAPSAFIQWKGTNVCMDFLCECGERSHLDGEFAYFVKCPSCGRVFEMAQFVVARRARVKSGDEKGMKQLSPLCGRPH